MRSNLDPRRNALCFPLDLKLTSQSVDLVGLPGSLPKPEVESYLSGIGRIEG